MVVPDAGGDSGLTVPPDDAPDGGVRAAIVTVGEELLNGQTVDTNSAWLGRELAALGIPVRRRYAVGDVAHEIRDAVDAATHQAEIVLVSGGLGPTRDDVTRDAVAGLFGVPVDEDPSLVAALQSRFREYGHARMPKNNRLQARVPRGAQVLPNPLGTAPGLLLEHGAAPVFLLPGVPREVRGLFADAVAPFIEERFGTGLHPVRHRVIHTTGISESRLAELVNEALPDEDDPVSVAFLPDPLGVDLRLSTAGGDDLLARMEARLAPVLAPWRFEAPSGDLAEALALALRAADATVAVAESCTGGLVSYRLTRIAGVSDVFLGGVVAYANDVKVRALGVSTDDLERDGAVSAAVATAMAQGVARAFGADWGVGITGVAGPDGGTDAKPVGTVWTAVSYGEHVEVRERRFPGDRHAVQVRAAQDALWRLLRLVRAEGFAPEP